MKPTLYLMVGYPGAGKTTVSQRIAKRTGAQHIWTDQERHKMFDQPTHGESESRQLYDHLNRWAGDLLLKGQSVVFDTNFNHYSDRELLRDIAAKAGARTALVWVTTPIDISRNRAVHSQIIRNGYDFTMTGEQFDAIANRLEPPREDENPIKIDGTNLDEAELDRLLHL